MSGALNRLAAILACAALLLMALAGVLDILLTAFFQTALPGGVELSESLLVACVFLPVAWTQARRGHVAMGFLRERLGPSGRRTLDALAALSGLGFFGVLAWQGWRLAWRSLTVGEYAAGLIAFPLYPAKLALAAGLTLMVLQLARDLLGDLFKA